MPFATTWMDLEDILFSEMSDKDQYCVISLLCGSLNRNSEKQTACWWLPEAGGVSGRNERRGSEKRQLAPGHCLTLTRVRKWNEQIRVFLRQSTCLSHDLFKQTEGKIIAKTKNNSLGF